MSFKYPVEKIENLWEGFPEWFFNENDPDALRQAQESFRKINDWLNRFYLDLVRLYDFLEKEKNTSNGEIPVKGCYINQQKQIELILGTKIETVRRYLVEMELLK